MRESNSVRAEGVGHPALPLGKSRPVAAHHLHAEGFEAAHLGPLLLQPVEQRPRQVVVVVQRVLGDQVAPQLQPEVVEHLERLGRELDDELASFAAMLERGEGPVRLEGDRLVVGRDIGDDRPASVDQLKHHLLEVFPEEVELAEAVIHVDARCGFSEHLLHIVGVTTRSPAMLMHLYAAILA